MDQRRPGIKRIVTAFVVGVWFSIPAAAQQAELDDLFAQLLEADETSHMAIANRIDGALEKSGSPAMDLLYRRGEEALEEGEHRIAVEHFTALIDHAPDFAEGYHGRASAYYNLDMIGPALDDLRQVLVLEPRHYDAMFGLGIIMEGLGQPENALEVYRAILEVYPLDPDPLEAIQRLELQLEGQAI